MYIDSHCHLNMLDLTEYQGDLAGILANAKNNGVEHLLCVSTDLETLPDILQIAEKYEQVSASVGLHPNEVVTEEPSIDELIRLSEHPKVVAIGETGLDYYRSQGDMNWQQQRFRNHIEVAKALNKPLIIHSREAAKDTIILMQEQQAKQVGGVMHCFTETWEMAQQAMELNFYISFSGIVTFRNAQQVQEVATKVPLERMLIETDAPYLAPVPFKGKRNEPAYVIYVAEHIAKLRGMDVQTIARATTDNYHLLFDK